MSRCRLLLALACLSLVLAAPLTVSLGAQTPAATLVQSTTPAPNLVLVPISATAAVNVQAVLTIPAPAGGLSNYICSLAYQLNQDATAAAVTNAVSTSTNFNAFAVKVSQAATVNIDSGVQMVLNTQGAVAGCVKSTIPGTATTFTSTASLTHAAWTWYATYFVAP